mgnify:CR=1 FL=1
MFYTKYLRGELNMDPKTFKYSEDHEWIWFDNNKATIGISKYAVDELGEIVFVECPQTGSDISQKDEFGTVESVKTVSSLYSPLSGKIEQVNSDLDGNPALLNESPEEKGWVIKLTPSDPSEMDGLMSYDEYQTYLGTL